MSAARPPSPFPLSPAEAGAQGSATPEEQAKVDRAMDHLEAQADLWAAEIDLVSIIKAALHVARLTPKAPAAVREKFIARAEANIDALVRQAFLEGMERGVHGLSEAIAAGPSPKYQPRPNAP